MASQHPPFVLAGIMGWPVAHSRSPMLHNHWIEQHGLHGAYVYLPVSPDRLGDAVRGLPALGFAGCNVTIPHKVAVMDLLDEVDPLARTIGAVNLVVVGADGRLRGFNTDGEGYLQSLLQTVPDWRVDAGPIAVMGAGGAARAVAAVLVQRGAREIRLCNRSPQKALALAAELGAMVRAIPWEQRHDALADAALLVNTTSQGMSGQPALDLLLDRLPAHAVVSDLVYVPLLTPLLAEARRRGHRTVGGLGMLLHQARPAFQAWFGVMPEVTPELVQRVEATL